MQKASLVLLLAAVALCNGSPREMGPAWDWRVVGGSIAAEGSAPYQVSLRENPSGSTHFCGGTIISSKTIVTAAHCLAGRHPSNTYAIVGTNNLSGGGFFYTSYRLVIHPAYNPNIIVNDVALVILVGNIQPNNVIGSIGLSTSFVGAGVTTRLTGWGLTSYPGSPPDYLLTINLRTISYEECRNSLANIYENQLCTFNRPGEGACQGDSGGPLVANGQLVGIVSWGNPCARGYPDVFTRVSSFANWIISNSE